MDQKVAHRLRDQKQKRGFAPAITLMFTAPLIAEVLPGATRFSSLFVFPIEMMVWGGGALLIRYVVRKHESGWLSMLLLALCLSIAEECLIQQTSFAPLVIKLKGQTYARAFGVNYVYFLWALIYESVMVVFLPVFLLELIFPTRKRDTWLNKAGIIVVVACFLLGSVFAWYTWTQIARVKVFRLKSYTPPWYHVAIAVIVIVALFYLAVINKKLTYAGKSPMRPFRPILLGVAGAVWSALLFGLLLLGLGIAPDFSPLLSILSGMIIAVIPLILVPRFSSSSDWSAMHRFGLICGTIVGSMAVSQLGFVGASTPDILFKIITNAVAIIFLLWLGFKLKSKSERRR